MKSCNCSRQQKTLESPPGQLFLSRAIVSCTYFLLEEQGNNNCNESYFGDPETVTVLPKLI